MPASKYVWHLHFAAGMEEFSSFVRSQLLKLDGTRPSKLQRSLIFLVGEAVSCAYAYESLGLRLVR